jgi:hypothetical protein
LEYSLVAANLLQTTEFATDAIIDPSRRARRVLILIHGIRDQPKWAAHFRQALADQGYDCEVAPVRYKRYSSVPFIFGTGLVSRRNDVLAQVDKIRERNEGAIFDVFCHSNGTRIFCDIVSEKAVPEFHTVILAGSICRHCCVDPISSKVRPRRFWNLCGKKDRWPILAEAIRPDLFEETGAAGFTEQRVFDNYYNFGHSGALKPGFIKDVIIPKLLFGESAGAEGAPADSVLHDPYTYRKIISVVLAFFLFSLRYLPLLVAIAICFYGAYVFYKWHDQS